jgi:hypothetical protein
MKVIDKVRAVLPNVEVEQYGTSLVIGNQYQIFPCLMSKLQGKIWNEVGAYQLNILTSPDGPQEIAKHTSVNELIVCVVRLEAAANASMRLKELDVNDTDASVEPHDYSLVNLI